MRSLFAFVALLLLFLVLGSANAARTEPGGYWKAVMKDQPMPDTIRARIVSSKSNDHLQVSTENSDCDQKAEKNGVDLSGRDFDFDTKIKPSQLLVWREHEKVDKPGMDLSSKDFDFDTEIKPSQLLVWREHKKVDKPSLDLSGKDFDFDAEIKPSQLLVWREHMKVDKSSLDLSGKDFDFDAEIKPSQLLVWREHLDMKAKENI
ncbi:Cdc15p [Tripterygium wilfordii]|uniref:Cdc15p n=1 Tax=Tripterygium wilfordii TaxID=458696 RepID=A0A7J7CA76_TRIWF|nr:Cdc15p [Tripterygium wilfordii]